MYAQKQHSHWCLYQTKRKEEREEDALSGHWRCMPQDGRQGHQRYSAFEDLRDTPGYAPFSVAALSPTDEFDLHLAHQMLSH